MKRALFLAGVLLVAFAPAAWASNPNHPGGCHGANNVPCRPDPQPTHGADCAHSDDHSCEVTTSTSTTAPPATTTTSAPSTITTGPAGSPSSPTTTTTAPGSLTISTARLCDALVMCPATPAAAPTDTPAAPAGELPMTGSATGALAAGGFILILAGLGFWAAGKVLR